jgi:hypothetical protein
MWKARKALEGPSAPAPLLEADTRHGKINKNANGASLKRRYFERQLFESGARTSKRKEEWISTALHGLPEPHFEARADSWCGRGLQRGADYVEANGDHCLPPCGRILAVAERLPVCARRWFKKGGTRSKGFVTTRA